jgi:ornithine carbamoyltransferase
MPNLISLTDLTPAELAALVQRAVQFANDDSPERVLEGRAVGIYFRRSSTRTRSAFWRAATRLGADVITYGPEDLQLITGETLEDTSRVLGQYLDALVVRTNDDVNEIRRLGSSPDLPVVNALSRDEHPTQAIADLGVLAEQFGALDGRHLLYVGEGNSSAAALAIGAALTPGFRLTVVTPPGYGLPDTVTDLVEKLSGGSVPVTQATSLAEVDAPVDAVYTSRWQTMGVPKADADWLSAFTGYGVDRALFDSVRAGHTIFLHDLPAVRGQEVTDEMLDGPESRAWRQAYYKMAGAMAVLEWCVLGQQ